ncbi:sulfotransferase family 2 domain-containing protein [Stratiformator vulcanicus]|uniref:Sulfotransferase family protein n=1 Tax=Stratiformator vulcanicus TaxID=2527980 RepID=A0A517QW22_9PLAN|nr:sulfotransferase family 2 domain-containing protein [Stratiformator vulcanicus]QDT35773.1 Sulfotransferase family protein [Stratiformator vulcanicus]
MIYHSDSKMKTPRFVTTIYGNRYLPFLETLLASLSHVYGQFDAIVLFDEVLPASIATLAKTFPSVVFEQYRLNAGTNPRIRIPMKLAAWAHAAESNQSRPHVFIDCDTIILDRIEKHLPADADVVYTWKAEKFPLNTGVMLTRDGEVAARVFADLLRRVEHICSDEDLIQEADDSYGAADQFALAQLLGHTNWNQSSELSVRGQNLTFAGLPCSILNETNCVPIRKGTAVVHLKGGWHPILLDNAPFSTNRPKRECTELYRLWQETSDHATTLLATTVCLSASETNIHRFRRLNFTFAERGILHSEMCLACSVSKSLEVDYVLESGRFLGQSTDVLAKFFSSEPVPVVSVELLHDDIARQAEERLAAHKNLKLLYGDAHRVLREQIALRPGKACSVLIDGPKGLEALTLLKTLMEEFEEVKVGFIHDMRQGTRQRSIASATWKRCFFSDDPDFLKSFAHLDNDCRPSCAETVTEHSWRPFRKGMQYIAAYGPTLGVFFRERELEFPRNQGPKSAIRRLINQATQIWPKPKEKPHKGHTTQCDNRLYAFPTVIDGKGSWEHQHFRPDRWRDDHKSFDEFLKLSLVLVPSRRAIFVHVPKTAGYSIHRGIIDRYASDAITAPNLPSPLDAAEWIDFFRFSVVRCPWDRMVSAFEYSRGMPGEFGRTFEEFVLEGAWDENGHARNKHWLPQHQHLFREDKTPLVDFIARFESLQEDWQVIADRLILPKKLPKLNQSQRHRELRHYYTDRLEEKVFAKYRLDAEYFGYSFPG